MELVVLPTVRYGVIQLHREMQQLFQNDNYCTYKLPAGISKSSYIAVRRDRN